MDISMMGLPCGCVVSIVTTDEHDAIQVGETWLHVAIPHDDGIILRRCHTQLEKEGYKDAIATIYQDVINKLKSPGEKKDTDRPVEKFHMNENRDSVINHPFHYTQGDIECIDAIEASLSPEQFSGFLRGNIIKYLWRAPLKGKQQDLEKAQWYLDRLIRQESE